MGDTSSNITERGGRLFMKLLIGSSIECSEVQVVGKTQKIRSDEP